MNIYSGDGTTPVEDSWMLIDDIELIYNTGSINELNLNNININVRDNYIRLKWNYDGADITAKTDILDISGRKVWEGTITANQEKEILINANKGIYICRILTDDMTCNRKIFIP